MKDFTWLHLQRTFSYYLYKWQKNLMLRFCSDETYLKYVFKKEVGYLLNLDNPRSYNEKLQWLKLHYKRPEYTSLVDKVEAKEYVAGIIGNKYIIPTLGIWDNVEDIDWNSLPNQFVVKSTNDSGGIVVCKDKSQFNKNEAVRKLKEKGNRNYTKYNKEYPYETVSHRYIAETYMEDESGYELKDYKFFCFNGEPKVLFVATDRQKKGEETKFDFFDLDWNHLPFTNGHPNNPNQIARPQNFEEMLNVARKLSKGMPQVRIDLYNCKGKIYFGEITFFHWSGLTPFVPEKWDYWMGDFITLPKE